MTYVLVPGAGGAAWYWSRVVPLLESAGHDAIAVDLPADDESAGPREYADIVVPGETAGQSSAPAPPTSTDPPKTMIPPFQPGNTTPRRPKLLRHRGIGYDFFRGK